MKKAARLVDHGDPRRRLPPIIPIKLCDPAKTEITNFPGDWRPAIKSDNSPERACRRTGP